jgi:hypothetical protein
MLGWFCSYCILLWPVTLYSAWEVQRSKTLCCSRCWLNTQCRPQLGDPWDNCRLLVSLPLKTEIILNNKMALFTTMSLPMFKNNLFPCSIYIIWKQNNLQNICFNVIIIIIHLELYKSSLSILTDILTLLLAGQSIFVMAPERRIMGLPCSSLEDGPSPWEREEVDPHPTPLGSTEQH